MTAGPSNESPDVNAPCSECGQEIPADSIFCPMCGNKTPLPGAITTFELPRVVVPVVSARDPAPGLLSPASAMRTRAPTPPLTTPKATPPPARVRAPALVVPDPDELPDLVSDEPTPVAERPERSGLAAERAERSALATGRPERSALATGRPERSALATGRPERSALANGLADEPTPVRGLSGRTALGTGLSNEYTPVAGLSERSALAPGRAERRSALGTGLPDEPTPVAGLSERSALATGPAERRSALAAGLHERPALATGLAVPLSATPARIPITPRPVRIVLGSLFLALAASLVLWFLPRHRPLSASEQAALSAKVGVYEMQRVRHTRLSEEVHMAGLVGSGGLALAGLGLILSGALYRAQVWVRCRQCRRRVVAWRGIFGLHCPQGAHYARVQWLLVVLTSLFWAALVAVAGLIGLWLLSI